MFRKYSIWFIDELLHFQYNCSTPMRVKMFKQEICRDLSYIQLLHFAVAMNVMTILRFVNRKHLFCDLDPFQLFSIFDTSFSQFFFSFFFVKSRRHLCPLTIFFSWSNCLSCLRQRISDSDFFEFIFTSFSTFFKKPITFSVFSVCKSADY